MNERYIMSKIKDITPKERELLSFIKSYPGMAMGRSAGISGFEALTFGYTAALTNTDSKDKAVFLPDGLNEYVAKKFLGSKGAKQPHGLFNVVRMEEKDELKALALFFSLLDEYLTSLGFEPVPEYKKIL